MLTPEMDRLGLAHRGKLHVLSDNDGPLNQKTCQVFDPSEGTWSIAEHNWPVSKALNLVDIQSMGDDLLYIMVNWGMCSSSIETIMMRDGNGDWHHVVPIPHFILADYCRPLDVFGYGFAALRGELYILGGRVLTCEKTGPDIVKLNLVRFYDPSVCPLRWRLTTPMCDWAQGSIYGCASLEE